MAKLKLLGGSSTSNSVSFFLKKADKGVKAIRKEDGTIVTEEIGSYEALKSMMDLQKVIFIGSLFKEFVFLLNLPRWLYYIPTIFWFGEFIMAVLVMALDREMCMYHGEEHKTAHWWNKKNGRNDIKSIRKCSRIHHCCGTNLIATIVTFQLASSICLNLLDIHIPEIIIGIAPFYAYKIFPLNFLGILTQIITTATPKDEHIEEAVWALLTLTKTERK